MEKASILIVESNGTVFERFGRHLQGCGYRVGCLAPSPGLAAEIAERRCDALITGDAVAEMSGNGFLARLRREGVTVPVIVMAGTGSLRRAVAAIQAGADDYLTLADDEALLEISIDNILQKKDKTNKEAAPSKGRPTLVAASGAMADLLAMTRRIAPSTATVLIEGESGTGKELLARYIHDHSGRGPKPLVAMNCAALPDNLAESELFGYERGAFTGAAQRKTGKFELAHQSTLLLDEISEMALPLQAKLLRVLQEKEVDRIGGRHPVPVDVRVIATTNRDLAAMVREGRFRQDLYYRLRILPLTVPPLRSRADDLAPLTAHFIRKHHDGNDAALPRFSAAAMEKLARWSWPGNVRELENTIQRAMLIRGGDIMGPELLLIEEAMASGQGAGDAPLVGMTVRALEERLIVETLDHVQQNRTHAAEMLGISIRTLRNKLREYRQSDDGPPQAAER